MIRLDMSDRTVLAVCTCGWRGLALDRGRAWSLAAAHEANSHVGTTQARQALDKIARRAHL